MTTPANIRLGKVYCHGDDCMDDHTAGQIHAEKIADNDDEQAWEVECPNCGATGEIRSKKGFNPDREVDDPFTIGLD